MMLLKNLISPSIDSIPVTDMVLMYKIIREKLLVNNTLSSGQFSDVLKLYKN